MLLLYNYNRDMQWITNSLRENNLIYRYTDTCIQMLDI